MKNKEKAFFQQSVWYHGTTLLEWKSICDLGIIADHNLGISVDFGCGFYLSPNKTDTEKYALDTVKYNHGIKPEDKVPVVIEFHYVPYDDIINTDKYKYFSHFDDEFADFVFKCRKGYLQINHDYEITGGVMTDTVPTKIMQEYFAGLRDENSVKEEFKRNTSRKQLCLHSQYLCDKLLPVKVYIVNGKELDVNEYRK